MKNFLLNNWRTNIIASMVLGYALFEAMGKVSCAGDPTLHIITGLGFLFAKDGTFTGITTHGNT